MLWVDEGTGKTLALEHPLGNYDDAVNPGGNAVFGSGAPKDETGRIWWVTGARANELAFDLSRSSELFNPRRFDTVLDDFETTQRSTAPTLSVDGQTGLLVYRYLHSTRPDGAVVFQRYDLASPIPRLEVDEAIGRAAKATGLRDVTIEQVWSRWDPRHEALTVTWQWFSRSAAGGKLLKRFGSNPVIFTKDFGETWLQADGSPVALPLTYATTTPTLTPYDHLARGETSEWFTRDVGFGPSGAPWITLPVGKQREMRFFYWGLSGWESSSLTTNLDRGDPVGCGATRYYLVCAFAESNNPPAEPGDCYWFWLLDPCGPPPRIVDSVRS